LSRIEKPWSTAAVEAAWPDPGLVDAEELAVQPGHDLRSGAFISATTNQGQTNQGVHTSRRILSAALNVASLHTAR
jgi:hypothetical protein